MQLERQTGDVPRARSVAGNVIRGSLGNLIEWYDWYAYAAFSIYFAGVFFPSGNSTAQLLNTAGIFAIGFLIRPLRLAVGLVRRPVRAPRGADALSDHDGRRIARHCRPAGLRPDRRARTHLAGRRPTAPGVVARRRVWNLRDVSQRSGHPTPARLLLLIPVRDVD